MTTKLEIFNRSLSSCGVLDRVSDPEENTLEAAECRLWYPDVRDSVMSSAPWPSVRRTAELAPISGPATRDPFYAFTFAPPQDLLLPYHLFSFEPFSFYGGVISTNDQNPILHYNARVTNEGEWDSQLVTAVTAMLAVRITPALRGDPRRLQENIILARDTVETARAEAANSEQQSFGRLPPELAARGYTWPMPQAFYFPLQNLSFK